MADQKRSALAKKYDIRTWRDLTPQNASAGSMLHNLTGSWRFIRPFYQDKTPACQNACPAGNDVEAWIRLIDQKDYRAAYWRLKREEPFPAILGRVCFRFCQDHCNRKDFDGSVNIAHLERFIGDHVPASTPHPDLPEYHDRTLAVVGSGPAGMAAAYFGRLLGFRVTMFEAADRPGGVLRWGIPAYRLSPDVVAAEFEGLASMGVELRLNAPVADDPSLADLSRDYDFVFAAPGAHRGFKLEIPGQDAGGVMSGLDFLKRVAGGEPVEPGGRVVVVGGGNTAVDAARTAVRLGADVTVVYRRTAEEMPAHHQEVAEAAEEGVEFIYLASPERIETSPDGRAARVVLTEMELGQPGSDGRRRPTPKAGAPDRTIDATLVLTAIGETPDLRFWGAGGPAEAIEVDAAGWVSFNGADNVLAGGDAVDQPRTVVHALASGKRAAIAADCRRRGLDVQEVLKDITIGAGPALSFSKYTGRPPLNPVPQNITDVVESDRMVFDYFQKTPRLKTDPAPPDRRKTNFEAIWETFNADQAHRAAVRCMHCGRCTECDNCLIFCPDVSVLPSQPGEFGYRIDYDYCKGCGVCAAECPRGAITMVPQESET